MNDWGEVLKPATLCAYCPKLCRFSCPVSESESRETVTPWSKMSLVYFASQGDNILEEASAQKAIEACTGCGACTDACAHGNPVAQTLAQTRHEIETPREANAGHDPRRRSGKIRRGVF